MALTAGITPASAAETVKMSLRREFVADSDKIDSVGGAGTRDSDNSVPNDRDHAGAAPLKRQKCRCAANLRPIATPVSLTTGITRGQRR